MGKLGSCIERGKRSVAWVDYIVLFTLQGKSDFFICIRRHTSEQDTNTLCMDYKIIFTENCGNLLI